MAAEIFRLVGRIALEGAQVVGRGLDKVSKGAELTQKQLSTAGKSISDTGKRMEQTGEKMGRAGGTLTKRLTLPLVALGGAAVKSSIEFESAWAGVTKTVDGTASQMEKLRTNIINMSKTIPASATEIANVAEAAGQLGIKQENIMKFTRVMIDMGESTNLGATDAATSLARLANITQMPMENIDRLGSTIVGLGNSLATTESEITEMALRVAGAGHTVGLTEDQILSFSGALSSVGIRAEAGGSAFSRVLTSMANAANTSEEAMTGFANVAGVSAGEFRQAFQEDAAGAVVSFIEGLGRIQKSGGDVFGTLDELKFKELLVRDTLLRAAGASDVFKDALNVGSNAWEKNNALTNEAGKRYETTASKIKTMWNRIKAVGITIGDNIVPAMMDMVKVMEPVFLAIEKGAKSFNDMNPSIKRVIVAIGLIAVAAGPILMVLGGIVGSIGTLMKAFGGMATVIGGISAPVLIIVGVLAGLAALFTVLYTKSETFRNAIHKAFAYLAPIVTGALQAAKNAIMSIWGGVLSWWKENGAMIMQAFKNVWNFLAPIVKVALSVAMSTVKYYFGIVVNIIKGAVQIITGIITFFAALFTGNWSKMWEAVKQILSGAWKLIVNLIQVTVVGRVLGLFRKFGGLVGGIFKNMGSKISGIFQAIVAKAVGFASGIYNAIVRKIQSMVMAVGRFLLKMAIDAATRFFSIVGKARSIFSKIYSVITSPIRRAAEKVGELIAKIKGFFKNLRLKLPKISMPSLPHFKLKGKFSLNPPSVPKIGVDWYDKGGIFYKPSVIGVGERRPEFVGALDDLRRIVREESGAGGMGGLLTVEVPLYLNGREIARASAQEIDLELARRQQRAKRARGEL